MRRALFLFGAIFAALGLVVVATEGVSAAITTPAGIQITGSALVCFVGSMLKW